MNRRLLIWLLSGIVLVVTACGEGNGRLEKPPVPEDPTRAWVERLATDLDEALLEHAEARATGGAIEALLEREAKRSWGARVDGGIKYADLFERLYDERENHKAFARSNGLSPRGEAVLAELVAADEQALDPAPYHVARIASLSSELKRGAEADPAWAEVKLEPKEAERLVGWMKERELDPHAPETRRIVLDGLLGVERVELVAAGMEDEAAEEPGGETEGDPADEDDAPGWTEAELDAPPAPRIKEQVAAFEDAFARSADMTAELELRTIDGALRFARDMKHFNLKRLDWRDIRDAGGSKKLIYGRLEKTFDDLVQAPPEKVAMVMEGLEPPHPQYPKLVKALARYRAIVASGGWERVRPFEFEAGTRHSRVPELRERLAREGFIEGKQTPEEDGTGPAPAVEGEANNATGASAMAGVEGARADVEEAELARARQEALETVDDELVAAVKSYQESHQYKPTGESSSGFWRSVNYSAERRVEQLELALQRWRETRYRGEEDFIRVNIPDFHAEVWFDRERTMRFRVVTGNNSRKCNPKTKKWEMPNATPTQVAELDHMIFNPYWNVPRRIVEEEIKPAMRKDNTYLEKNHYEFVPTRDGREWVRQTPGEHNALGQVKFIFPNPHNTYMHDTPKKQYFDYPVRGFSHGCVRVQTPLDLAEHLLEQDAKGDRAKMESILESGRTRKIEFDRKIPVFFEYVTVRVDEAGRTNFLADIYRKDRRRLSDDPEEYDRCSVRRRAPLKDDLELEEGETDSPAEVDVGP